MNPFLPFNRPYLTGRELEYVRQAAERAHLSGDGGFTRLCHGWLERQVGCRKALLTHSGTAALEMCALLADIQPGDEIVMPSFTFVSTANAFVLRGGVPVFVDVDPDTLTIDPAAAAAAVGPRTRAVVAVHYAGVACAMDELTALAHDRSLLLIEDAAQALGSTFGARPLGSFGPLAATSFHETKNIISGEGGALLINDERFVERAEVVREKGTNRRRFLAGEVDKYTWVDVGSSFLPSEITAAFLWAQMEEAERITTDRRSVWESYYQRCETLHRRGVLRRPIIPRGCVHNAHMFYVLLESEAVRTRAIAGLADAGVNAVFHYVPLHSSPAGRRLGRAAGALAVTDLASARLLRLPLWVGMSAGDVDRIVSVLERLL
ncbi:MAG TPA: dTDP-4-amino-4,6-dideoxygalactose transaminase [Vicinamibacterales bacterium]|jgi:dTDP-4-amino-4,6-dideoxygalactose transaminase